MAQRHNSVETILTYENQHMSDWSVIWSTTQIPEMDNAIGGRGGSRGPNRRIVGRRRLRMGSLVLGSLLTMHCRVPASALTGGVIIFMVLLIGAVAAHANPLRHFELYLGQWSISGPGRAFRIIPMLDGIGIAICINAVLRAICCCAVAAIAAVYVVHSVGDAKLPFTYCRDFDLNTYPPIIKDVRKYRRYSTKADHETFTVGLKPKAWRNLSQVHFPRTGVRTRRNPINVEMCLEYYDGIYPALISTPAYNFFYVEVVQFRSHHSFGNFNLTLLFSNLCVWGVLWIMLIMERLRFGRLVWNNVHCWMVVVPWMWVVCLTVISASTITSRHLHNLLPKLIRIGPKDLVASVADALEVALYIHSAGMGTEIIIGKGLNHYASGHIDPDLHGENVLHSCLLLALASLHSVAATLCALVDYIQPSVNSEFKHMRESTLWIIPMYSKCTANGGHSHLVSTLVFGGLMFSYMAIAFSLLKSALHTIFEYRVKLVFVEQYVVGGLLLSCILSSVLFSTNGGIALLESVDSLMTGVAMSYVCFLELCGLLYVYRSPDFISDMNVATEENTCNTRLGVQWQIIPLIAFVTLILKMYLLMSAEFPNIAMFVAIAPLAGVVCSVPIRACHNAYVFLRPQPRRGT